MTTGRWAGSGSVPATGISGCPSSTAGWSVSPTSAADTASALICTPGRVAPTGVPGLTAKDHDSSGHALIILTNYASTPSVSAPQYSDIRSVEVNTTMYGCPSTCSRRQAKPGSPGRTPAGAFGGIGISTLASSRVDRKWSVWPSPAAARSSVSTLLAGVKSASSGLSVAASSVAGVSVARLAVADLSVAGS